MKKNITRIFCIVLVFILIFSLSADIVFADVEEPGVYSIQSAVRVGISNSILLQQLDNKVTLSRLKTDAYNEIADDLADGKRDLGNGEASADSALGTIDTSQDAINQAKMDIAAGILPQGADPITIVPGALIIEPGDDIKQKIDDFNDATHAGLNSKAILANIKKQVNTELSKKQKELNDGKAEFQRQLLILVDGKIDYKVAKANITSALADKLDISDLSGLTTSSATSLMYKLADAAARITVASQGIYRNQIALQIQNSYYNVLKAKKLVEVKELAMKRAESQYQFAKDSYEAGMKAKDDMLLANIYYTGTKLEYQKAQDDYYNAQIELKKNMGIPMEQTMELEDVTADSGLPMDLESGLKSGLESRLEIIIAMQQDEVYKVNQGFVQSEYNKKTDQYTEAEYLRKNADLEVERVKKDVESSIRQSYNTMVTMADMLSNAQGMVDQAKECVDIAQSKYTEGFGGDSTLLKKLGMEASSGTVLEVISAEENLAQVEEKYVQILYGYNLSKAKYLNDIAYLTY